MNKNQARKLLNSTSFDARIAHADRHALNVALTALIGSTLGRTHSLDAWYDTLTLEQALAFEDAMQAPAPAKSARPAPARQACGHKFCAATACKWVAA